MSAKSNMKYNARVLLEGVKETIGKNRQELRREAEIQKLKKGDKAFTSIINTSRRIKYGNRVIAKDIRRKYGNK